MEYDVFIPLVCTQLELQNDFAFGGKAGKQKERICKDQRVEPNRRMTPWPVV